MLPSPGLYFAFLAVCAAVLALASFRHDRLLGWIVIFALSVNFIGAGLMGWWVQRVHGREYSGGDEVSYQWEGQRLLASWRTGDTSYVRATVGIFAPINAAVISVAGPGYTPMRLTTALVGAIGVAAAFWLAMLLYRSVMTARIAAFLCATSPLLILFSWANLRERWIGTAVLLAMIAAMLTILRPTWRRVAALIASVWLLTELRHYWGTLVGYLVIAGSLFFGASRWPRRLLNTAIVTIAVGCALWAVTETFLGLGIRHETVVRYVPTVASQPASAREGPPPSVDPSLTTPSAGTAQPSAVAAAEKPAVPYSGPTLGESQAAPRPTPSVLIGNASFILFGRVHARADGGQFASVFLLPEALWSVLLFPLALVGVLVAVRRGNLAVLIPAAYVGAIMAVLSWLRGEDWSTYRFRNLYWPVLLILVAGGITWTYEWWIAHRQAAGAART